MDNIGTQLIAELGHRGQRGMYFDYAGYRELHGVETLPELLQFLKERGIVISPMSNDPAAIADALTQWQLSKTQDLNSTRNKVFLVAQIICGMLFCIALIAKTFEKTTHTYEWEQFNRVAAVFKIPAKAKILSAGQNDEYLGRSEFVIRFELPTNRSPEDWVRKIAHDAGFRESHRMSDFEYERVYSQNSKDRVSYSAQSKYYEVQQTVAQ